MKPPPLHARIRVLAQGDLRALEWRLPGPTLDYHQVRYARQQAGELTTYVAWYDETSIGHVVILWNDGGSAGIDDVFVLPPFRRRGVGGQLAAVAEAAIRERGGRSVTARIPLANRPARRLFIARGFDSEGKPRRGEPVRLVKAFA